MNAIRILIVAGVFFAACGAQADTRTFTGFIDNTWNEPLNWENEAEESGVPDSTDTAIIPAFKIVKTNAQDAECEILEIALPGRLEITEGSTFTLHGGTSPASDSTIGGFILFATHENSNETPVLKIMNDTTILGGGNISPAGTRGIIRGNTSSTTLTITNCLLLAGNLDIEIALVNNATVNPFSGTLNLKTNAKSGNGIYQCSLTGTLNVDVELTGTAMLWLTGTGEINIGADSPNFAGDIWCNGGTFNVNKEIATSDSITIGGDGNMVINAAVSMTGSVTVATGGTLTVNEDFCTTGNIHYSSAGIITVAGGATPKSASFGGFCSTP